MEVSFIGQGLQNEQSVGTVLIDAFSNSQYNNFTAFVAFAGTAGVRVLRDKILSAKTHISNWAIFVGVDQKGTSKEALEALLSLDIGTKIYYTKSQITYHPKIYLFEGVEENLVIVGSSNLTERGLFSNIEASAIIKVSRGDTEGERLLQELKNYYNSFLQGTNLNVQILSQKLISKLKNAKIIPTERERRKIHETIRQSNQEATPESIREVEQLFPSISISRAPRESSAATPTIQNTNDVDWEQHGTLIWQKNNLPQSDILHEGREGTHITGELRFTKAGFQVNNRLIDQTKYFRYILFGKFPWTVIKTTPLVDATTIPFRIKLLGEDIGEHELEIRHKPSGEAGQNNFTTSLRWGSLSPTIRNYNLLGKTLLLYAPPSGEDEPFFIDIQ